VKEFNRKERKDHRGEKEILPFLSAFFAVGIFFCPLRSLRFLGVKTLGQKVEQKLTKATKKAPEMSGSRSALRPLPWNEASILNGHFLCALCASARDFF
jgi:hypothetical protein